MKTYIAHLLKITVLLLNGFLFAQTNPNHIWVNGYTKSNGTYVEGHYRTAPNSTNRDNFSTVGNTNPYTGKPGWIPADNNPMPTYSYNGASTGTSTYTYTPSTSSGTTLDFSQYYDYVPKSSNSKISDYSGIPPTASVTNYTTTSLRLREGPSTADEIILTIPTGAAVKVVDDFDSWAYVYYGGYYGYAATSYLSASLYITKAKDQFVNSTVKNAALPSYGGNHNGYNQSRNISYSTGHTSSSSSSGGGKFLGWIFGIGIGILILRWLSS
jgi:uncharacterized protein YgiM (DUF1202 family)